MTERLATALRKHRHLRHRRVLCKDDGTPLTRQGCWSRVRYAAHRAKVPAVLLDNRPVRSAVGDNLETPGGRNS